MALNAFYSKDSYRRNVDNKMNRTALKKKKLHQFYIKHKYHEEGFNENKDELFPNSENVI